MYRKLINKLRECSRDKDTLFREAADVIEELQMEKTDLIAELKTLQYYCKERGYGIQGEWETDDVDDENVYVCSICGKEWLLDDGTPEENEMRFCPRCGSDMRGSMNG